MSKKRSMSADQKLKISESVKRARATRLAKAGATNASSAVDDDERIAWTRGVDEKFLSSSGGSHSAVGAGSHHHREEALRLATDLVDMISDEVSPLVLVKVIDRILRS